jgi:hypothetical protein
MTTVLSAPAATIRLHRKVTSSGVIWLQGRPCYVSRLLAEHVIPIEIHEGTLVIDATVPLRKEYWLPRGAGAAPDRVRLIRVMGRRDEQALSC